MEVKCMQRSARAHTHTLAHTHILTHLHLYIDSHPEMAQHSWDTPNRVHLSQSLSVHRLTWDLVWSSRRGTVKMSHLPWQRSLGVRTAVLLCYWGACTALPFTAKGNPLLWDLKDGDGTRRVIARGKRKIMKELLSTHWAFVTINIVWYSN